MASVVHLYLLTDWRLTVLPVRDPARPCKWFTQLIKQATHQTCEVDLRSFGNRTASPEQRWDDLHSRTLHGPLRYKVHNRKLTNNLNQSITLKQLKNFKLPDLSVCFAHVTPVHVSVVLVGVSQSVAPH